MAELNEKAIVNPGGSGPNTPAPFEISGNTNEVQVFGEPGSPAEELRMLHEQIHLEHSTDLSVPRFGGKVLIRYRAPGDRDIAEVSKKIKGGVQDGFDANVNLLIRSCIGVYMNKGDKLVKIMNDSQPVKFDSNLAKVIGVEAGSAKDVLRALFGGGEECSMAIHAQAQELIEWAETRQGDIKKEFSKN